MSGDGIYEGLTLATGSHDGWGWTVCADPDRGKSNIEKDGYSFIPPGPGLVSLNIQAKGGTTRWMPLSPDGAIELAKHLIRASMVAKRNAE